MKFVLYFNLILILLAFNCCTPKTKKTDKEIAFFPSEFTGHKEEILILEISAKFAECGEWGGHEEKMFIYLRKDNNFYLKYKLWCADCDSLIEYKDEIGEYAAPYKYIVDSCQFKLNKNHKNAIYIFAQDLITAKFSEGIPGHGNNDFNFIKYDYYGESIKINAHSLDPKILVDYVDLLKSLNLFQEEKFTCIKYYGIRVIEENE